MSKGGDLKSILRQMILYTNKKITKKEIFKTEIIEAQ